MKKKIGLLMGSFNPIHNGHMGIANYVLEFTDVDEIMFIVSPQNPFKQGQELLNEVDRFKLVETAIGTTNNMLVSTIEFHMEKPSYSVDTLKQLQMINPDTEFVLIMGSDNLLKIKEWRDYEYILENFGVYVYKRIGYSLKNFKGIDIINRYNIKVLDDCPMSDLSSTFIRESIISDKNVKHFLPCGVYHEIIKNNYYK